MEDIVKAGVVVAVGAAEPHAKAITSQVVAIVLSGFCGCVHPRTTELNVVVAIGAVNKIGFWHVGAGAQVILATHPEAVVVGFEVKTKVKHPSSDDDVIAGGIVVPE